MAQREWFTLIDNELGDLRAESARMNARFWQRAWFLAVLVIGGSLLMGLGTSTSTIAIGCFTAVTGVVGYMALVVIFHIQQCLYRAIDEMRKLNGAERAR
jgi:membrane associated rhomboid family serine protease